MFGVCGASWVDGHFEENLISSSELGVCSACLGLFGGCDFMIHPYVNTDRGVDSL